MVRSFSLARLLLRMCDVSGLEKCVSSDLDYLSRINGRAIRTIEATPADSGDSASLEWIQTSFGRRRSVRLVHIKCVRDTQFTDGSWGRGVDLWRQLDDDNEAVIVAPRRTTSSHYITNPSRRATFLFLVSLFLCAETIIMANILYRMGGAD